MNCDEALKIYLDRLLPRYSRRTMKYTRIYLNKFLTHTHAAHVRELTPEHVRAYAATLTERYAWTTRFGVLLLVKVFLTWLYQEHQTFYDLSQAITLPNKKDRKKLPHALTEEQVKRILKKPNTKHPFGLRDRTIMEVMYAGALRCEEVANLNLYDYDAKEKLLRLYGKNKKERIVPIGEHACFWLERYIAEIRPRYVHHASEMSLFVSVRGGYRISSVSVQVMFQRYSRRMSIRFTAHTFRHTAATHLIKHGANVRHVQAFLGHTSLHTTQIYTHLDMRDLKKMIRRYHPRGKKKM